VQRDIVMPTVLLVFGGSLFGVLGLLHAWYTFRDIQRPRRIVPDDPAVTEAMRAAGVRLARGGTTMWRTWVGLNFSHSLGVVLFAACTIGLGLTLRSMPLSRTLLLAPVAIGALYVLLAVRYWFRIPVAGTAVATACFVAAWVLY
jgi:energy-converting hydrogenase Eha subunit C